MKVTKFRAWDILTETMIYSSEEDSIFILENGEWEVKFVRERNFEKDGIEIDAPVYQESDEVEIMQYTGLKDKNGIEIYEGDIVKRNARKFDFDKPDDRDTYYEEEISFVEYRSHGFWIHDENFGWEGESLWEWHDIEAIGNIYENPELLKQQIN